MKPTVIAGVLVVVFVLLIGAVTWTLLQKAPPPPPQGTVRVLIGASTTNAAWAHVNATFDLVRVHEATGNNSTGWSTVQLMGSNPEVIRAWIAIDLEAVGANQTLAQQTVPKGNYTAVLLHLSKVVGILQNGTTVFMNVVGNATVAVAFRVNESATTPVTISFNLQQSIHGSWPQWYFSPVAVATAEAPK